MSLSIVLWHSKECSRVTVVAVAVVAAAADVINFYHNSVTCTFLSPLPYIPLFHAWFL